MNAQDFIEMNKQRALRRIEENKDHPRSHEYIVSVAVLNFIEAYEMEVGTDVTRQSRGYWENVPLVEDFEYYAVTKSGEQGYVHDIEKRHTISVGMSLYDKNDIVELRVKRRGLTR